MSKLTDLHARKSVTTGFAAASILALALGSGLMLTGCEEGTAEEAGENVDEAVEEAGDAMEDTADDVEDEMGGG
jgi:hypothetical protein